jgi:hypothetical protein
MAEGKDLVVTNDILESLTKPWQKFLKRFDEINDLQVSKWAEIHVLAYICKRYREHYGRNYSITIKGAPSKSPDMYLIKRMMATLNTTNMKVVKEYVDWIFDVKIIPKRKRIRTLAFFVSPGLGNEFHFYYAEKNKITRSTVLPDEYKALAVALEVNINTYGELAFIKMALDQAPNSESRQKYKRLLLHLKSLGFEESQLEGLK